MPRLILTIRPSATAALTRDRLAPRESSSRAVAMWPSEQRSGSDIRKSSSVLLVVTRQMARAGRSARDDRPWRSRRASEFWRTRRARARFPAAGRSFSDCANLVRSTLRMPVADRGRSEATAILCRWSPPCIAGIVRKVLPN